VQCLAGGGGDDRYTDNRQCNNVKIHTHKTVQTNVSATYKVTNELFELGLKSVDWRSFLGGGFTGYLRQKNAKQRTKLEHG